MKISTLVSLVALFIFLAACTSATSKLTKKDATESTRIVYGKIIDLNPDSIPADLQLTYTLNESPKDNILAGFDNKFPKLEPKSNFFWIAIPSNTEYFGVNSIRFKLTGVDGEAIIRNDKTHAPLFGTKLQKGNSPIYIGDITIRSGMRKYTAGLETEGFDLKEAYIKNNLTVAKDFLDKNGIDSNDMVITPFKLRTQQQAKQNSGRSNKL